MPRKKSKQRPHYAPPPGAIPPKPPPPPPPATPQYDPHSPPASPYACELLFEQVCEYTTFMLSAKARMGCDLRRLPEKKRRTFVVAMMDDWNAARIEAGLAPSDYTIPSYVTVMAVSWDELKTFDAGTNVLELNTITYMVSRVWRAVRKLKKTYSLLDFYVVDYDRSISQFGMMVGVQVFLGVPLPMGSVETPKFDLRPLPIGPITDNIVSHFLHLFTVKLGWDSGSDTEEDDPPDPKDQNE